MPRLYYIGRLCERFHCLPSELERESAEIIEMAGLLDAGDRIIMEQRNGNAG